MKKAILVIWVLFGASSLSFAQTSKDVNREKMPELQNKSLKKKKKKGFKLFKKKQLTDREQHEAFREKIEANQKQKAKDLKKADKPQYTDPLYFGHKRPPKKRKNDKKKFCKECGLSH